MYGPILAVKGWGFVRAWQQGYNIAVCTANAMKQKGDIPLDQMKTWKGEPAEKEEEERLK